MSFITKDKNLERLYFEPAGSPVPISLRVLSLMGKNPMGWVRCGVTSALVQVKAELCWHWASRRVVKGYNKPLLSIADMSHAEFNKTAMTRQAQMTTAMSLSIWLCLANNSARFLPCTLPYFSAEVTHYLLPLFVKCPLSKGLFQIQIHC